MKPLISFFQMCIYYVFLIICNLLLYHTAKYVLLILTYIKSRSNSFALLTFYYIHLLLIITIPYL